MSRSDYANALTANVVHLLFATGLSLLGLPLATFGQCTLSCNDGLNISLDATGQAQITTQLIAPNAAISCPGQLQLRLFTQQGFLISGNTLDCSYIGQTITAQVKHLASGNSCSGTLQVYDALPPVVVCSEKFIFCNQDATPGAIGLPVMTDNCTASGELNYTYSDSEEALPCGTFQNGVPVNKRIDRTWFVTDAQGNSTTCVQKIWLKHITLAGIVFPPSLDGVSAPALQCGQDPYDLLLTGQPTVDGIPIDNSPDCEFGITYADQMINICPPAGFSILRTWTAIDFCSGTISNRLQIIKVQDKTPPEMVLPGDMTVGTDGFLCSGTVFLPQADVSDDCSAVTVTTSWAYGSGFGPFPAVGMGTHVVTYTAIDACGNSSTATLAVTVEDTSPPQAICSSNLQVSVSTNGIGFVNAGSVDQGSFDNCGPVELSISRDDILFFPALQVSCADIGTTLEVFLKVTDAVGLENRCTAEVNVRDLLKPNIFCPANVVLTCQQNHLDTQLTGQADATDNCGLQSIDFVDFGTLSACNTGTLQRLWTAVDEAGNTKSCVQQVVLQSISNIDVVFPQDVTVNGCADPATTEPPATGEPAIDGQYCSPLSITYTDQIFSNPPPPVCTRILRSWKVIDFCIYDPNDDSTGIWEHTQIVDIIDVVPPVLIAPSDVTVGVDQTGCVASVAIQDAQAIDCGGITVENNSSYASSGGANASGQYPVGIHLVVFTATDNCGNSIQQTMSITVSDLTAPVAVCKSDLAVSLDTSGQAMPPAALFDGGSTDNCSPAAGLIFSVFPEVFDCQSTGLQQVVFTVSDEAGNTASCQTTVNITDPSGACLPPPPPSFQIEGTIRTPQSVPVADIPVDLAGDGFFEATNCDSTGYYFFEDVPAANIYTLRPHNNANWLNGVSTFDLVLISKHILGLDTLDTPYRLIAADANRSGSITTFDIVSLRKLILGITDTVAGNTSWRFIDAKYAFPDPGNPFDVPFPESIFLGALDSDMVEQDFIGVKIGDLNNTTNPAEARNPTDTLLLRVPGMAMQASSAYDIPVSLKNWSQLDGFQFELALDPAMASLREIEFSRPEILGEAHVAVHPGGKIAVSWVNESGRKNLGTDSVLFVLHLSMPAPAGTQALLRISGERILPEVYDVENELFASLKMQYGVDGENGQTLRSIQPAFPNPFCSEVVLPFTLNKPDELSLRVSDATGNVVLHRRQSFAAGPQEWHIRQSDLPARGVYYFQMIVSGELPAGGKILLLCD